MKPKHHCEEYARLSRRGFLGTSGTIAAALATAPAWMPKMAFARGGMQGRDALVTIFLRGGMDGLSTCVPYFEDATLMAVRPDLRIAPPGNPNGALDLDGMFGLAPACGPLLTPWSNNHLAIVHATGSTDPSRSHFDSQKFMETATPNFGGAAAPFTGWLGRHLQVTAPLGDGLFRAMALEALLPRTLAGGPGTLPIPDPDSFSFPGRLATAGPRRAAIENMYAATAEPLASAAVNSLATIDLLDAIDFAGYVPANGAVYPNTELATALRSIAATLKDPGTDLEAAHIDIGNWDHHNAMGPLDGILAARLTELSAGLEAFYMDMLNEIDNVVVVVMSEFGRRVAQNASAGADHGHGNCMLVMGGGVAGGQVLANWPGLAPNQLDDDSLAVTIDYRDILAEILQERLGNMDLATVFPPGEDGYVPDPTYGITV